MRRHVPCLPLLLLALAACGPEEASPPPPTGTLTVMLDGKQIATLDGGALRPRLRLREAVAGALPAEDTWLVLEARSPGRVLRVPEPTTRYHEQDFCLFLGDDGRPAVGIFRRDRPELTPEVRALIREPTLALTAATSVHVRTHAEPTGATPAAPSVAVVTGDEEPRSLTGDRLATLRPFEPGGNAEDAMHEKGEGKRNRRSKGGGYHLADVLALIETRPIGSVRLVTGAGQEVVVDRALLDARSGLVPTLKLNRRGQFNYRPVGAERGPQLRDVRRIEITLRD